MGEERVPGKKEVPGSCENIVCHSERSEEAALMFLKTNKCRFFASLRMTGLGDYFTRSRYTFPAVFSMSSTLREAGICSWGKHQESVTEASRTIEVTGKPHRGAA